MIGRSTAKPTAGRFVTAKLVEAIPVAGALLFELVSNGRAGKRVALRSTRIRAGYRRDDRLPRKRRG